MDLERHHEDLAEGLWAWVRHLAMAMHRLEGFSFHEGSPGPEEGSLAELQDPARQEDLAREFVLRVFRVGADAAHYRLLRRLRQSDPVPLAELARLEGTGRLAMTERLNEMVQAGLVTRILETDSARPTRLAEGLMDVIEDIAARVAGKIGERAPRLGEGSRP